MTHNGVLYSTSTAVCYKVSSISHVIVTSLFITFHRMKSIVSVVEDKKRKQSTGRVPSCAKKPRVSKCAMYMYVIIHVLCIFCHLNLYMCVLYYM